MSKKSDPDFAKTIGQGKKLETDYGDLGRHSVADSGLGASGAERFVAAIERLHISSLPDLALVPRNLETSPSIDQLVYERESKDLQVLGNQVGLNLVPLTDGELTTIHENDAAVILAGLYITYEFIETINGFATLVEFFTNVAKFYGSRRTKDGSEMELSQEIIIRKQSTVKRLSYRGPASGLPEIVKLMQSDFDKSDGT